MEIMGDEGDGCRVVDGSVIHAIPPHLPISFFFIDVKMKSRQEDKILEDSSTNESPHMIADSATAASSNPDAPATDQPLGEVIPTAAQ